MSLLPRCPLGYSLAVPALLFVSDCSSVVVSCRDYWQQSVLGWPSFQCLPHCCHRLVLHCLPANLHLLGMPRLVDLTSDSDSHNLHGLHNQMTSSFLHVAFLPFAFFPALIWCVDVGEACLIPSPSVLGCLCRCSCILLDLRIVVVQSPSCPLSRRRLSRDGLEYS